MNITYFKNPFTKKIIEINNTEQQSFALPVTDKPEPGSDNVKAVDVRPFARLYPSGHINNSHNLTLYVDTKQGEHNQQIVLNNNLLDYIDQNTSIQKLVLCLHKLFKREITNNEHTKNSI